MKGYLYKDIRQSFAALFGILILFLFLCWAVPLSSDGGATGKSLKFLILCMFFMFQLANVVLSAVSAYEADCKIGFKKYAAALLGGIRRYIMSKYAFIYMMTIVGALLMYTVAIAFDLFLGKVFLLDSMHWIIMIASAMGIIIASIHYPFVYKFGSTIGNIIGIVIIIGTLLSVYIYFMFGDLSSIDNVDVSAKIMIWIIEHRKYLKPAVVCLLGISIVVSYISRRLSVITCINDSNQD